MADILCSVATKGRYHTTLPMVLQSIAHQTRLPDRLVIFDDNDEPEDMREDFILQNLFKVFDAKGLKWEVIFAPKKGQHHIHQMANMMGHEWVWRVDDDCIPDPNVLEELERHIADGVGAIGGAIYTPPGSGPMRASGRIENIDSEPNIQWGRIDEVKSVDHLHCSFLYRARVHDFNLGLSRVAHREETLFTYGLKLLGYEVLAVPNAESWHLRNPQGGIRSAAKQEMFDHDEQIFRNTLGLKDKTVVVLDCGMGDHIVFSHVLPDIKDPVIFTCYPDIVPGRSIAEAKAIFGGIEQFNVYQKMDQWKWKGTLEDAFRRLYVK